MSRVLVVAIVILLAGALVGAALVTRYRYSFERGVPLFRVDRWTGRVQQWDACVRRHEEPIPVPSDFDRVVKKVQPILQAIAPKDQPLYLMASEFGLSDLSAKESDKEAWREIAQWIDVKQKENLFKPRPGRYISIFSPPEDAELSSWLNFLDAKKDLNKDTWDLTREVCEADWK